MDINETCRLLLKDKLRNINMINFMKNYPIFSIDTEGQSVMVRGRSDNDWVYISSQSEEEFLKLTKRLNENDQNFAIIEDWMMPHIIENRSTEWILSCMKLYLPDDAVLTENKIDTVKLSTDDAEYVFEKYDYREFTSIEYIKERIENGIALGIYEDGILAGWIITHDDGAMGFLNVLPRYRKSGYGFELTLSLVKKLRAIGEIPFVHIEEDNEKSMNLAKKTGFILDRRIHWFKRNNIL